jgi:hypothetical protein
VALSQQEQNNTAGLQQNSVSISGFIYTVARQPRGDIPSASSKRWQ